MYSMHPDLMVMFVNEHHEDLRRAAGEARLRREVFRQHRQRRRQR